MEFSEVINKRRSIRRFLSKEVEEEKLEKIFKTVQKSPSAGNLQAFCIYVVKDKEKRKKIACAALGQEFIAEAPVNLIFLADLKRSASRYGKRGKELYAIQDATIAAILAWLAAVNLGLASCWVGAFDEEELLNVLNIPSYLKPVAILPLGYKAAEPSLITRRSLSELIKYPK